VRPGDSPFAQPAGGGSPAGLVQAFSFFLILALSAPAVVFGAFGLLGWPGGWYLWSLVAGVGVGILALVLGTLAGARVYERRSSELLAAAVRN
jgi:ABC-2 type transport system permease protein